MNRPGGFVLGGLVGVAVLIAAGVVLQTQRTRGADLPNTQASIKDSTKDNIKKQSDGRPGSGEQSLVLGAAQTAQNGIAIAPVTLVKLAGDIQLVGTVSYDQDFFAVVGPLVAGRVARLNVGVGDKVSRGQVLGEIESADVGQARADYIAAKARASASEINLGRETELAELRISSAREREVAQAQSVTERAALRAAAERLRAIGFSQEDIAAIETRDLGGRVPMRAPIAGVVLRRSVTLGQAIERATDAFEIADRAHVWVDLDLYEKDLPHVQVGQTAEIRADSHPNEIWKGRVAYVVPIVEQATRTAKVRVELPNPLGKLSFGQLVTARLVAEASRDSVAVIAIPRGAIQRVDGRTVVFVKTPGGFERRGVELGFSTGDQVEVRQGVKPGDEVVADGAFLLKSELLR